MGKFTKVSCTWESHTVTLLFEWQQYPPPHTHTHHYTTVHDAAHCLIQLLEICVSEQRLTLSLLSLFCLSPSLSLSGIQLITLTCVQLHSNQSHWSHLVLTWVCHSDCSVHCCCSTVAAWCRCMFAGWSRLLTRGWVPWLVSCSQPPAPSDWLATVSFLSPVKIIGSVPEPDFVKFEFFFLLWQTHWINVFSFLLPTVDVYIYLGVCV